MIAKSDVIILVVSASALAAGIYRWQSNMNMLSIAQNSASSPTAAVLDGAQSANTVANSAQPVNASVASSSTTAIGSTATTTANNTVVVNGNSASSNSQSVTASSENNTAATLVVGNAIQPGSNTQPSEPLYGVYRVRSGDYLGKIAENYGTTVETLRSINNIEGSLIDIDQEILYPLPAN